MYIQVSSSTPNTRQVKSLTIERDDSRTRNIGELQPNEMALIQTCAASCKVRLDVLCNNLWI